MQFENLLVVKEILTFSTRQQRLVKLEHGEQSVNIFDMFKLDAQPIVSKKMMFF